MAGTKKTSDKRMSPGGDALRPVSSAVRPIVKSILPASSVVFQQLFDIWADLMAGTEAAAAIPEKLVLGRDKQKDGVLHLWTKTGAEATELTFNKMMILRKINAHFGYSLVADLRVTAFPTAITKSAGKANDNTGQGRIAKPVKGVPCQSLDKILQDISNPALREVLADFSGVLESNPSENMEITGDTHA